MNYEILEEIFFFNFMKNLSMEIKKKIWKAAKKSLKISLQLNIQQKFLIIMDWFGQKLTKSWCFQKKKSHGVFLPYYAMIKNLTFWLFLYLFILILKFYHFLQFCDKIFSLRV